MTAEELKSIPIYRSSKGEPYFNALEVLDKNAATIAERRAVLDALSLFIASHGDTLAGLNWTVAYLDRRIVISRNWYRGEKVSPRVIAKLWPNAKWERARPEHDYDNTKSQRDWITTVDGIELRIESAETWEPTPPLPEPGTPIDFNEEKDQQP